jgi:hypothetical protein
LEITLQAPAEAESALRVVQALPFSAGTLAEDRLVRVLLNEEEQVPEVISALVRAGLRVYAAVRKERPLEEVYLELMRRDAA